MDEAMSEATEPTETKAEQIFDCSVCRDNGNVRLPFQTLAGEDRFKEMPCPECFGQPHNKKPGAAKWEFDSMNRRLRQVESKQDGLGRLIAAAVVIGVILLALSYLRTDKPADAFAQAVKEQT